MIFGITACVLSVVLSFFLWAAIHEYSHFFALKHFRPEASAEFFLYPHVDQGKFFWARISWNNTGFITYRELAWVSFAPRFLSFVSVVGVILLSLLGWSWYNACGLIVVGGGVIDLLIASIGYSEDSDLQRVCRGWGINPWILRVPFILFASTAILAVFVGMF